MELPNVIGVAQTAPLSKFINSSNPITRDTTSHEARSLR
jgi:hypothetical protein